MNILQKIIATLNKEESRFYKLFAGRTNSKKERKDILLFDYIKQHKEDYNESFISKKLYKDNKNAYNANPHLRFWSAGDTPGHAKSVEAI